MNQKNHPIRLDDLAEALHVSKVTISKALRDHPDISIATTQRVKELAEKMGYMPNIMARTLSAHKSRTIGLVIPEIAHIFFASIIDSIYDAAFENNYEIILTVSQEQDEREKKHILSLLSMRVDGLIVSVTQQTNDLAIFEKVNELGVPLLFIDRTPKMPNISSITVNDMEGAFNAIEYGIKKGYTRIAHCGGYRNLNIGRDRYEGFMKAMNKHSIPVNDNWVIEGGLREEDGYNAFMKMYKNDKNNLPEYILAISYPVALGIYTAALEVGINIPSDIEITCFGLNTFNKYAPSIFNFVNQPTKELGKKAFDFMIQQIDGTGPFLPKNIVLDTELIINHYIVQKSD
ncbi:MAG: LacI family DNA-binding transcriptional regulator [Bacteroidota bacterium]|nr:LacI family DNA-binding transcriptional regulator [Bacteroidota bacterium]